VNPVDPLGGLNEKILRATRHTDALEGTVAELLQQALYVAVTENHFAEGEEEGHFAIRAYEHTLHPVNELGVIIGDVVHNLRSALDHLAWQLAILDGCEPPPALTEFPIFLKESDYEARTPKTGEPRRASGLFKVRGLDPNDQAMVKSMQPFHTHPSDPKGAPLWVLHDLANIDKHRICPVTIPAVRWTLFGDPEFSECEFIRDEHFKGPYRDRDEVARYYVRKTGANPKIVNPKIDFSYEVHFADGDPGRGKGLFWGLDKMREAVVGVVALFAARFPQLDSTGSPESR
jgi:hypothetical protein